MDSPFPPGMLASIEALLRSDAASPDGLDVYPAAFASELAFPLQRQREMAWMMREARKGSPRVVMEIGSDKAGGLYHWCRCLPSVRRVIACEIRGTPYAKLFAEHFPGIDFLWLPRGSRDAATLAEVRSWLKGEKIDRLFIDGDKAAFAQDFDAYLPLMAKNGVVFMHDIQDEAPRAAFDSVTARGYRVRACIDTEDAREAMRRGAEGVPPSCPHEAWLRHWHGRSCGVAAIHLGISQVTGATA